MQAQDTSALLAEIARRLETAKRLWQTADMHRLHLLLREVHRRENAGVGRRLALLEQLAELQPGLLSVQAEITRIIERCEGLIGVPSSSADAQTTETCRDGARCSRAPASVSRSRAA